MTQNIDMQMKKISAKQKKLKKDLLSLGDSYVLAFKKELGENRDENMNKYITEKVITGFDEYKNSQNKKEKDSIIKEVTEDIYEYALQDNKDLYRIILDGVTAIYEKTIEALSSSEINEMNYQLMKINMLTSVVTTLSGNIYKVKKKEYMDASIKKVFSALDIIGECWIKQDMVTYLDACVDIIVYSTKSNYFEPDISYENISSSFTSAAQSFLTTVPGKLLFEALDYKLKNPEKKINITTYDKMIVKLKKFVDESDTKIKT